MSDAPPPVEAPEPRGTATSAFGVGRRENHDASAFYARFSPPDLSDDDTLGPLPEEVALPDPPCVVGDARDMSHIPDRSVALVVTSPPYFVGKEYEQAVTGTGEVSRPEIPASYVEYLEMLRDVFAECKRTLEPGGRIAVNIANLGRKPYRSLSADVIRILQDDLGLLLRGEIIWQKAEGASGSVAWGSFNKATNPVLRDITERVIVASKGRFDRARSRQQRVKDGYPHENTMPVDEFMEATLDVWRIDAESARRVQHPAPFPIELPRRLIELYTFENDLILDPFLGSGTTLVAAVRSGRRGVGYDLDADYVEIATNRYR
ncbi:MAG: site-specific DNA-methyltransferase, partial [Acidimicrobiia bacterium]|nr:site-specific DNA-methyltransferase [Acidimicrobiia bacterium]